MAPRYQFFYNFFSDLGMLTAYEDLPNTIPAILFAIALTGAGIGLALFFVAFTVFFQQSWLSKLLSWGGALAGVVTGLSFVGVAFTPADVLLEPHISFVYWAFTSFLGVVILNTAVIFIHPTYPRRYAAVFCLFALLLAGYLWILFNGPSAETTRGLFIQATGQKIIAYASIITTLIVSYGAWRLSTVAENHSVSASQE